MPTDGEASGAPARRGKLALGLAVVAVLGLAGVERGVRYASAALTSPTGLARWIWADGDWWGRAEPTAFDVACDFPLTALPAKARLAIAADEEFSVWLNARWVGAGRYVAGSPLTVYDVADLLEIGGNRLLARVRSARGAGGLLASISAGDHQLVATGGSCRVLSPAGLPGLQGWYALPDSGRPKIWGLPPTGRWGEARLGPLRAAGALTDDGPSARCLRRLSLPGEGIGDLTLFEFPEAVHGVVELDLEPGPATTGLLFVGETAPPDPRAGGSDLVLVTADDDREWIGAVPGNFRYLLVAGLTGVRGAEIIPTPEGPTTLPAAAVTRGVFGLQPPPKRSPVEDEILRRLGGFEALQPPALAAPPARN
jgi:hypothetical protein